MSVREATDQGLTNVTIDWSFVFYAVVPNDRVDALYQASETGPSHVQASSHVQSYSENT
jgi:hypothetical protein